MRQKHEIIYIYIRIAEYVRYVLYFKRSIIMHGNIANLIKNLYNKIRIFKGIQLIEFSMKTIPK